jgi:tetratricopeptide (TPR) repeat protein
LVRLFFLQWVAGREREARDEMLRLVQLDPLSGYANVILSFSDFCSGRLAEALNHARQGVDLDPNSYLAYRSLMNSLLCNAQYEEAAAAGEQALAISGRHTWALAAAAVGDMDRAISIAQRAVEDKGPLFVMLARTWPGYDQLRADSRFLDIARQLALPDWNPTACGSRP